MTVPSTNPINLAPRARGLPVLGVLPQLSKGPLDFFLRMAQEYGGIVRLDLGPSRFHLVTDPELIKVILQDNNKNYVKGYEKVKPLLGEGLVSSEGELWLRQRRLIQPMFARPSLVSLLPIMTQATHETIQSWQEKTAKGEALDIAAEMMLLTQTIILRTMFSADIGERSKEIAAAFSSTLEYMNMILLSPFSFVDKLPTPTNRRFHRSVDLLEEVIFKMIAERRRKGAPERDDLLSTLLNARDENGQGMSDRQVRDEVMTIFLAGHETTATLLAWTFFLLGQHREVEERVRAEINSILDHRVATADDISLLTFTRQVLDEALRLYPPAWMFARRSVSEDSLGGYHLPAGSMIFLSPYVTHHLPAYWENPAEFNPERFTAEASAGRARFAYFPFGGGPRLCLGNNFALLEAPLILSMMMQAFQFELVPGQQIHPQPVATLRPKPAVWMKLTTL